MSSYESSDAHRWSTADTVAGFLATLSIFASAIGLVWHPMRLVLPIDRADRGADVGAQRARRLRRRDRRRGLLDGQDGDRGRHRKPALLSMSGHDVDGPNAGYARLLLEDYLEDPHAVPPEWRELFESGDSDLVASHPGLLRLLEKLERDDGANGQPQIAAPAAPRSAKACVDRDRRDAARRRRRRDGSRQGHRMHGHLAARLDPLGSEPLGDLRSTRRG